jgi:hypothetical protein
MLLTVISTLPVSERCTRILACLDRFEHVRESLQIVVVERGGDVEVTGYQPHTVQHGGRRARYDVVDAGFAEYAEQGGHVGWLALQYIFGRLGHRGILARQRPETTTDL